MKNLSLIELSNATASKDPVPGGGSVSAVCGVLSAALAEMVANLTIGKKKYLLVDEDMKRIKAEAYNLRESLLDDIEKDSDAFTLVMNAYGMPKETQSDELNRYIAIQKGLVEASLIPYEVAKKALKVMELSRIAIEKGNVNTKTDGLVSLMLARTAVLGALFNVKINLESIEDKGFTSKMLLEVKKMQEEAIRKEEEVICPFL